MQRWLVSLLHLLALICLSSQARQLYGPNSSKPEVINDLEHDERLESNDCGQRPALAHATGSRVSGGYEAGRDEFPSFVSLKVYHGKQYSFCGGTILGPRLVLTAGHCIVGATMLSVSTSKYHPNHWPMSYDEPLLVKRSCRAANYTKTRNSARHDYGIVILEKALKFHGQVQPACLPDRPVEEHESFLAVGIGQVHHSGGVKKRPKVMQAIPMQPHLCKEQHRTSDKICFRSSDPRHVGATCKGKSKLHRPNLERTLQLANPKAHPNR